MFDEFRSVGFSRMNKSILGARFEDEFNSPSFMAAFSNRISILRASQSQAALIELGKKYV
jgi:hypothetical protein